MKTYYYFNRFTDKIDIYAESELTFIGTKAHRTDGGDFDPFTTTVDIAYRDDGLFADKRAALVYGIEVATRRQSRWAADIAVLHNRIEEAEALERFFRRSVEYEDRLRDGSIDIEASPPVLSPAADF